MQQEHKFHLHPERNQELIVPTGAEVIGFVPCRCGTPSALVRYDDEVDPSGETIRIAITDFPSDPHPDEGVARLVGEITPETDGLDPADAEGMREFGAVFRLYVYPARPTTDEDLALAARAEDERRREEVRRAVAEIIESGETMFTVKIGPEGMSITPGIDIAPEDNMPPEVEADLRTRFQS